MQEFKTYLKGDIYLDEQVMKYSNKTHTIYIIIILKVIEMLYI